MGMDQRTLRPRSTTPAYDAHAQAFFTAAEITDSSIKNAINTAVVDYKESGNWDRDIAIYPWVGASAAAHKWNLKDPRNTDAAFRMTFHGTVTHSANGVQTNGVNGYADTKVNLNEDVAPYSLNIALYSRTATAPGASDYFLCGVRGAGGGLAFDDYFNDRVYVTGAQTNLAGAAQIITANSQTGKYDRLRVINFRHFDSMKYLRDGVLIAENTNTRYQYWPHLDPTADRYLWLFGENGNNSLSWPSDRQLSWASVGLGRSDTMLADQHSIISDLQTALGRAV